MQEFTSCCAELQSDMWCHSTM